jgi:hypothetical protein
MNWLLLLYWLDQPVPEPLAPGPIGVFAIQAPCEIAGLAIAMAISAESGRPVAHKCVTGQPT